MRIYRRITTAKDTETTTDAETNEMISHLIILLCKDNDYLCFRILTAHYHEEAISPRVDCFVVDI